MTDTSRKIFEQVLELPFEERPACVEAACGADADLRAEVLALLREAEEVNGYFEETQARSVPFPRAPGEDEGSELGNYRLLQKIGEGGFGTVWMAEQLRPVRRRVALKIIKAGMDTKEVVARFEQERQALAVMDHPNIARVFDAGSTESGRPYFVMELVDGVPLTRFCDEQQLPVKERLVLFIDVCLAIHHAHQKGIIHRDIKPSNIMVALAEDQAVVKVIDFGIAKATQQPFTEKTVFTRLEQFIGTPAYMSPEQASSGVMDIDTRSDIYALGILLYELLTGKPPFDTASLLRAGFVEMRRVICEQEPPKPSARISTVGEVERAELAKSHQMAPVRLGSLIKGDLDWIVLRAIEKDRNRRYETAGALVGDIRHFLANEPVSATPPGAVYLFRKFARRHRLAFVSGTAIAASLILGIAVSLWQAMRARATLEELRGTAPAFAEQARALGAQDRFAEAVEKLDYAMKLCPDVAEYPLAKGDLQQSQLKLPEALESYRIVLRLHPGHARAAGAVRLCEELLAAPPDGKGGLSRESLARLHLSMQQQQRPASEMMTVARLLGTEKSLLVSYWLTRLQYLPVSDDRPLKDRLRMNEDGSLHLDLSQTRIIHLAPLKGMPLSSLDLRECRSIFDLDPLRDVPSLVSLQVTEAQVTDLTPLRGLPLKTLNVSRCPVSDLIALRGTRLESLDITSTRIGDITPLKGMKLTRINVAGSPVSDFTPLVDMPLEEFILERNRVTDLSFLRGMPLRVLSISGCPEARNYSVLSEIKTLETLVLPDEWPDLPENERLAIGELRKLPKLRQIGTNEIRGEDFTPLPSQKDFWQIWDRYEKALSWFKGLKGQGLKFKLQWVRSGHVYVTIESPEFKDCSIFKDLPLRGLILNGTSVTDLRPLENISLASLSLNGTPVRDLSPLRAPALSGSLRELKLGKVPATDFTPLAACKDLQNLHVQSTAFSDLSVVQSRRLGILDVSDTPVTDLSVLAWMPLFEVNLGKTRVSDLSPLLQCPVLKFLVLPPEARNVQELRSLSTLVRLSRDYKEGIGPLDTVAGFWKLEGLRDAGVQLNRKALPDGTWEVNFEGEKITDLTPLQGAPISKLWLGGTRVSDLSPLKGMPLTFLRIFGTKVTDLSPLAGMPLTYLQMSGTAVKDISVLRGMPLVSLFLQVCPELTNIEPLTACSSLKDVTLPPNAEDVIALRPLTGLKRLSYTEDRKIWAPDKTAAQFWQEYDDSLKITLPEYVSDLAQKMEERKEKGERVDYSSSKLLALLYLWLDRREDHDRLCRHILKAASLSGDVAAMARAVKPCLVDPEVDPSLQKDAKELARRACALAVDQRHGGDVVAQCRLCAGIAEYRDGNDAKAEALFTLVIPNDNIDTRIPAYIYRALSRLRSGSAEEADQDLKAAKKEMKPVEQDHSKLIRDVNKAHWLFAWLACKEADLIFSGSAAREPKTSSPPPAHGKEIINP